jgi:hypothetical protein
MNNGRSLAVLIVNLAYLVFWVSALSAALGSEIGLSQMNKFPPGTMWPLAGLIGFLFGLIMVETFLRLRGIRERYEKAPINGATGARIALSDLLMPYLICFVLSWIFVFDITQGRRRHGLKPLVLPHELIYFPLSLMILMALALLWSRTADAKDRSKRLG